MPDDEMRTPPGGESQGLDVRFAGDTPQVTPSADVEPDRCRVCGHRITSERSISAGVGTDCRRRLRSALRGADADVVAAYAIVLGAA